jgi:hypothetical protein
MFPRFGSRFEPEGRGFESLSARQSNSGTYKNQPIDPQFIDLRV